MKKVVITSMIALLITLALALPVLAHEGCELVGTLSNGATILYCPAQAVATPTPLPEPTATATATLVATALPTVAPTVEPSPTPTMHVHPTAMPTATPVPGATPIAQYPTAPKCPSHDQNAWHGIWDSVRGCYYDHTHMNDPDMGNDIFGDWRPFFAGAWVPPWGQSFEHHMGAQHGGWKVRVWRNLPTDKCKAYGYADCIDAARVWTHQGLPGGSRGTHTFFVQYRIRHADGTFSFMSTGGAWVVTLLHSPYKQAVVQSDVLLSDLVQWQLLPGYGYAKNVPDSADPYRAHVSCEQMQNHVLQWMEPGNKRFEKPSENTWQQKFWIQDDDNPTADGGRLYGMNPFIELSTNVPDATACITGDHTGIKAEPFVFQLDPAKCPKLPNGAIGCRQNDSVLQLFSAEVDTRMRWLDNSQWDMDKRAGWLDINTFIKPQILNPDGSLIIGRPDPRRFFTEAAACKTVDAGCAPLVYRGRATYAYFETPVNAGYWEDMNFDAGYAADGKTLLPGFENVWWLSEAN